VLIRALRGWFGSWQDVLWSLTLVGLLVWRWPVLKGYYYKFAHVASPASAIPWRTDLTSALAESKRTGKPVLVDFWATWCPPCLAMKHDTWTDARVERAVDTGTIPLEIDIDRVPAAASRYGVESIPTVLMLDGDGKVLRTSGFLPADGVVRFIENR
jgi:thiol-disulfide isomerase/thioredoxin